MLEVKIGGFVFKCKDPDELKVKLALKLEADKKKLTALDGERKIILDRIRELSKHVSTNQPKPSTEATKQ